MRRQGSSVSSRLFRNVSSNPLRLGLAVAVILVVIQFYQQQGAVFSSSSASYYSYYDTMQQQSSQFWKSHGWMMMRDQNKTSSQSAEYAQDDDDTGTSKPSTKTPNQKNKKNDPLNILILYPDDWRYDVLQDETNGPNRAHTPFLSSLARRQHAMRFTHNSVTTSICWISRATLFTGQYGARHQSNRLYCPLFTTPQQWQASWPALLQRHKNYYVGHVGKWQFHNGKPETLFNWSRFHEGHHWYDMPVDHQGNIILDPDTETPKQRLRRQRRIRRGQQNATRRLHAAERAQRDAIYFLRHQRPRDTNFALTVAFYPPKSIPQLTADPPGGQWQPDAQHQAWYENVTFEQPYNYSQAYSFVPPHVADNSYVRERYDTRWKTNTQYQASMKHYYALVSQIDDASRAIVEEVERQGLLNQTLIIVTADNGLLLGAHGLGGKWHPYTESIRVPLLVYDPRMTTTKENEHPKTTTTTTTRPPKISDAYTLNIDLAPTILGAAGLPPHPGMQGRDLADLYVHDNDNKNNQPPPWRSDFYYEFPLPEFPASTALVTRRFKYIRWQGLEQDVTNTEDTSPVLEQIFDLQHDPHELNDLLQRPQSLSTMQRLQELYRSANKKNMSTDNSKERRDMIQELLHELRKRHDELEREVQARDPSTVEEPAKCVRPAHGAKALWP